MLPFDTLLLPVSLTHKLQIAQAASANILPAPKFVPSLPGLNAVEDSTGGVGVETRDDIECVWDSAQPVTQCLSSSQQQTQYLSSSQQQDQQQQLGRKIRLGFLSYDFNDHPTAHLVEGIFDIVRKHRDYRSDESHMEASDASHTRRVFSQVELVIFSYGKHDTSSYRLRLEEVSKSAKASVKV